MKIIKRQQYLKTLWELKDKSFIKVVTGLRRAGKSTLLQTFCDELKSKVKKDRIQFYNLETKENQKFTNWQIFYDEIIKKLVKNRLNYIFLDEIQSVNEFERLLDALYVRKDIDLYVTGSNAFLLSSDLATLLTGRSYEVNILPFSLKEFAETYPDGKTKAEIFADYFKFSSLPQAVELLHENPALIPDYMRSVYVSILEKDIYPRRQIYREQAFFNVRDYMMDNIGNQVSPYQISRTLAANHKAVSDKTVEEFLRVLTDCFMLYRLKRFDVKGKQHLATLEKYYLTDLGFRHALLGKSEGDNRGFLLENLVFLELKRRNFQLYLGKVGGKEVDFVAQAANGELEYYQVAYSVRDEKTLARELEVLKSIKDHNPKFILTLDEEEASWNGIKQINAINWFFKTSA